MLPEEVAGVRQSAACGDVLHLTWPGGPRLPSVGPMRQHTGPARLRSAVRRSTTRPASYPTVREDRERAAAPDCGDDPSRALSVQLRADLAPPRLTVAGELDLSSAGLVAAMLDHVRSTRRGGPGRVEVDVDLERVVFADTAGLAPVLDSGARIVAASVPVRRVLRLLGDAPEVLRSPA